MEYQAPTPPQGVAYPHPPIMGYHPPYPYGAPPPPAGSHPPAGFPHPGQGVYLLPPPPSEGYYNYPHAQHQYGAPPPPPAGCLYPMAGPHPVQGVYPPPPQAGYGYPPQGGHGYGNVQEPPRKKTKRVLLSVVSGGLCVGSILSNIPGLF